MNAAKNTAASTITSIIPRYAPLSDKAMIFYPSTRADGQIQAYVDGKIVTVGIDVYMATERLTEADSKKVALEFAKHENIDPTSLIVRQRLPKTQKQPVQHNRRTNDAALTLVQNNGEKQQLARAVQDMQDKHDADKKAEEKQPEQKASAANPEGATVRQKRKYVRKGDKEISKRSAAALRRYESELRLASQKSETMQASMQAAAAETPVEDADKVEQEKLAKALRLAKAMLDAGLI